MSQGYLPNADAAFHSWAANFTTAIQPHLAALGLVEADIGPMLAAYNAFDVALGNHQAKRLEALAASESKRGSRTVLENHIRAIYRRINGQPGLTNDLRHLLGLTVPKELAEAIDIGLLVPGIYVQSGVGKVVVHFGTLPQNEHLNGKPAGAKGANIYRKGPGEDAFRLLVYATSSPYEDVISGSASDYAYMVRYRGTKPDQLSQDSPEATVAVRGTVAA